MRVRANGENSRNRNFKRAREHKSSKYRTGLWQQLTKSIAAWILERKKPWARRSLDLIGTLMRPGFLIAVTTISASAQTREEIATLKAQVAALQTTVSALQSQLTSIQNSNVFALNRFVSVDPNPENGVIGPDGRERDVNRITT